MATLTYHHLGHGEPPPKVVLVAFPTAAPLATVALDDHHIEITGRTPADLLVVADAFTDAARQLSDALDKHAAAQVNAGLPEGVRVGASCPCGSKAEFTDYSAAEAWEQEHADCTHTVPA